MSIGSKLYNLRKMRNLTQTELSNALGKQIAQTTLGQYELGIRSPSQRNIRLLADFYGLPVSYFYMDEEASDEETAAIVIDMMHKDPEYRTLFDLSRKVTSDDLKAVNAILRTITERKEK